MATRTRSRFPHAVSYIAGPFVGVKDSRWPMKQDGLHASEMINVALAHPQNPGVVGRPGFERISATQMGSASGRTGQADIRHTTLAGVRYTFFVAGGKVYRVSFDGTLTDVTPVDVSISLTARVYARTFADVIIVTDGTNRPWKMTNLSSTPVTGTYLTGVPGVVYGPPAIYYAKLFFIKNDERNTIIWSEENDPDLGYEAGDYNNAWTLAQTDTNRLTCLIATNVALYYFRERSIGAVQGAVSSDFVNAGVHDAISTVTGTRSPAATILVNDTIYFLDEFGRPHALPTGGATTEPIWEDIGERVGDATDNPFESSFAAYEPELGVILFGTFPNFAELLVYHVRSGKWLGWWTVAGMTGGSAIPSAAGAVLDPAESGHNSRFVILSSDGYAYMMSTSNENDQADYPEGSGSSASVVGHSVRTPWMGYSDTVQQRFTRVDFTVPTYLVNAPSYSVTARTNRQDGTTQAVSVSSAGEEREVRGSVGTNVMGRACQATIAHSSATTKFSLGVVRISGIAISDAPGQY